MPALFAALEDRLSAEVDRVFAEQFDFLPMAQATVNSRSGTDATRTQQIIAGVFDDRNPGSTSFARLGNTKGGVASVSDTPRFATSAPMLFFDAAQFGATMPVRRLDRFRRRDTGDVYEVTGLEKDGQGRWKATMTHVAKD